MSFLSAANLIIGGIGAYTAVKGIADPEENKDIKRSQELALQQSQFIQDLAEASINPSDPRYQALIAESRDADFANLLMGHQQQAVESRRHQARGGLSTVSDRQDEAHQRSFRALDYPGVANERRNAARQALINATGAAQLGISGANVAGQLGLENERLRGDQLEGDIRLLGESAGQIDRSIRSFEDLRPSTSTVSSPRGSPQGDRRIGGRNFPFTA